jgi:hypothetical protein
VTRFNYQTSYERHGNPLDVFVMIVDNIVAESLLIVLDNNRADSGWSVFIFFITALLKGE